MYTQQELNLTFNDNDAEWTPGACTISLEALAARTADLLQRMWQEASLRDNGSMPAPHAEPQGAIVVEERAA